MHAVRGLSLAHASRRRRVVLVGGGVWITYNIYVESHSSPCWFVVLRHRAAAHRLRYFHTKWSAGGFRGLRRADTELARAPPNSTRVTDTAGGESHQT